MLSQDICDSFNRIRWHDSKLRSFSVDRDEDGDYVVLQLELRTVSTPDLTPATMTLIDATYMRIEVDLESKYQCGDDISSAICLIDSELKKELVETKLKNSPCDLDGYYLFDFYLIPFGGRLQIFAREFRLALHTVGDLSLGS